MPHCTSCGNSAEWRCTSCQLETYCSKACQSDDWASHQLSCASTFSTKGGLFVSEVDDLGHLMAVHVKYTQDLLVSTVSKNAAGVDRAIDNLIDNKREWVKTLVRRGVSDSKEWYAPGPENGGLGDGVFLRHSLAAKGVIDGVTGLNPENTPALSDEGGAAFHTLYGTSLSEVVDFWESRRKNEALTQSDIGIAWKSHLDCTIEYARQLLIAEGEPSSPTYVAAARACKAQGKLVGAIMESVIQ